MKNILITGAAGFIGYHLVQSLISEEYNIVGLDSLNSYYDVKLKLDRLEKCGIRMVNFEENDFSEQAVRSSSYDNYRFFHNNIINTEFIHQLFEREKFDIVINLAAQAGVRYSLINPKEYIESNVLGFLNILEACKNNGIDHLFYASSSSVYGQNYKTPFSESDPVEAPASIYACTKRTNELMAQTYDHLYNIKCTGLRFFTVYGPFGRPDMAIFLFTEAILKGEAINVFNNGDLIRDFTYIDDIITFIKSLVKFPNSTTSILNLGNNKPVLLSSFIECLETKLKIKAKINNVGMQKGDVKITHADIRKIIKITGIEPKFQIQEGISKFIDWYRQYYRIEI